MADGIDKFLSFLERKHHKLQVDAGLNGDTYSPAAYRLRTELDAYQAARSGVLPESWKKDYSDFIKQQDPEYEKYLELKKKFE